MVLISVSDIVSAFSVWGDRVSPHYEGAGGNCKYLVLNVPTSTWGTKEARQPGLPPRYAHRQPG